MSQQVTTEFGTGRIVASETNRGNTSYKVEGEGFSVWLTAAQISDFGQLDWDPSIQNRVNYENSTTLPYNPQPQFLPHSGESTIQPNQHLDTNKRLTPADSVTFEGRPEVNRFPRNFAPHTAGARVAGRWEQEYDDTWFYFDSEGRQRGRVLVDSDYDDEDSWEVYQGFADEMPVDTDTDLESVKDQVEMHIGASRIATDQNGTADSVTFEGRPEVNRFPRNFTAGLWDVNDGVAHIVESIPGGALLALDVYAGPDGVFRAYFRDERGGSDFVELSATDLDSAIEEAEPILDQRLLSASSRTAGSVRTAVEIDFDDFSVQAFVENLADRNGVGGSSDDVSDIWDECKAALDFESVSDAIQRAYESGELNQIDSGRLIWDLESANGRGTGYSYSSRRHTSENDATAPGRMYCPQCGRDVRVVEVDAFFGRDKLRSTLACGHVVSKTGSALSDADTTEDTSYPSTTVDEEYPGGTNTPGDHSFEQVQARLGDKYIDIPVDVDRSLQARLDDDPYRVVSDVKVANFEANIGTDSRRVQAQLDLEQADPQIREAAWADVRAKATRLRRSGAVQLDAANSTAIIATVTGDHGVYDVAVLRGSALTGNSAVQEWSCSCPWGDWAFERERTFVGRLCSHAYAAFQELRALTMRKEKPKDWNHPAVDGWVRSSARITAGWERDDSESNEVWRNGLSHVIEVEPGVWWGRADRGNNDWEDVGPFQARDLAQAAVEAKGGLTAARTASLNWKEDRQFGDPTWYARGFDGSIGQDINNPVGVGFLTTNDGRWWVDYQGSTQFGFETLEEAKAYAQNIYDDEQRTSARHHRDDGRLSTNPGSLTHDVNDIPQTHEVSRSDVEEGTPYPYGTVAVRHTANAFDDFMDFSGGDMSQEQFDSYCDYRELTGRPVTDSEVEELNSVGVSVHAFLDDPLVGTGTGQQPDSYGTSEDYVNAHERGHRVDITEDAGNPVQPNGDDARVADRQVTAEANHDDLVAAAQSNGWTAEVDTNNAFGELASAMFWYGNDLVVSVKYRNAGLGLVGSAHLSTQDPLGWAASGLATATDGDTVLGWLSAPASYITASVPDNGLNEDGTDDPDLVSVDDEVCSFCGDSFVEDNDGYLYCPSCGTNKLSAVADDEGNDVVAAFQRNAGAHLLGSGSDSGASGADDFAGAAERFLRTAGRNFTLAEQQALMDEEAVGGPLDQSELDLGGTHYLG